MKSKKTHFLALHLDRWFMILLFIFSGISFNKSYSDIMSLLDFQQSGIIHFSELCIFSS